MARNTWKRLKASSLTVASPIVSSDYANYSPVLIVLLFFPVSLPVSTLSDQHDKSFTMVCALSPPFSSAQKINPFFPGLFRITALVARSELLHSPKATLATVTHPTVHI